MLLFKKLHFILSPHSVQGNNPTRSSIMCVYFEGLVSLVYFADNWIFLRRTLSHKARKIILACLESWAAQVTACDVGNRRRDFLDVRVYNGKKCAPLELFQENTGPVPRFVTLQHGTHPQFSSLRTLQPISWRQGCSQSLRVRLFWCFA